MKIGALIPIRLASERLPGKALLPIAGRAAVLHLLDRVFDSAYLQPERVVVCTTEAASDDPLVPVVESTGARIFRGSRDNVIRRFRDAVRLHGFDAVIQADGDDPFTDTEYMDRCMARLLADDTLDLVQSEGLPIGLNSKAIRTRAIVKVEEHCLSDKNDHGFVLLFTRTELCKVATVQPVSAAHQHSTARITLDYPEDLEFFNALHDACAKAGRKFGVAEIVAALNAQPQLVDINSGLAERYRERTDALLSLQFRRDGRVHSLGGDS